MAESKDEPLVQLADLCVGCVRYILENQIAPPNTGGQMSLFEANQPKELLNGKDSLINYFYRNLRRIKGYGDINLLNISYQHRFSIFPFSFKKSPCPLPLGEVNFRNPDFGSLFTSSQIGIL